MMQRGPDDLPEAPLSEEALAAARARLATKIRALRERHNLSQATAASRAGIKEWDWQRLEAERKKPNVEALLRIQYAYGLHSLEDFFGESPTERLLRSHDEAQYR